MKKSCHRVAKSCYYIDVSQTCEAFRDERKHSREKTKWKGSLPALCCRATNSSVTSCQWKRNKSLIKQCDSRHPAQPTDLHGYQCPSMHCLTRSSGCDTKETKEENLHKFNWFWQQILPRLQLIFIRFTYLTDKQCLWKSTGIGFSCSFSWKCGSIRESAWKRSTAST